MSKYELIIEYTGDKDGAIDWAKELQEEWNVPVIVNEINDKDEFVRSIEVPDKVDTTG
jgi:hypothetical protein